MFFVKGPENVEIPKYIVHSERLSYTKYIKHSIQTRPRSNRPFLCSNHRNFSISINLLLKKTENCHFYLISSSHANKSALVPLYFINKSVRRKLYSRYFKGNKYKYLGLVIIFNTFNDGPQT